ncbi:MAG: DUF2304 domain-containing protein [Actinomycetaceae bacterium]|nr:DUF2304 domain-containing protein [Actinomycetaceae bacterium]MDY5855205.1 DUF2304 domain-containing protein [Arcanobacterium sp.]
MLIKIILIAAVLVIAYFLVRSTANVKNVALRRLLLVAFVLLAIISIVFPQVTSAAANLVGVGRGADLLLYLLIIAFLSYAVVSYRRMNILEWKITDLARELTIARSHPQNLTRKECPVHDQSAPRIADASGSAPQTPNPPRTSTNAPLSTPRANTPTNTPDNPSDEHSD